MSLVQVAVFVTSHGFGHAARACAVMSAIHERNPHVRFHIFTESPEWFFEDSLEAPFTYHPRKTDVGLIQESPFSEDIPATLEALGGFTRFDEISINSLITELHELSCNLILCDIAPLGIFASGKTGIPSVLVENFTWDWIYKAFAIKHPEFSTYITSLRSIYQRVDFRIKANPCCENGAADLVTSPISRQPRQKRQEVRAVLGIPTAAKMILVTMGGIPDHVSFQDELIQHKDVHFLLSGTNDEDTVDGNIHWLPYHSNIYHPDLVFAADAVVGKLGYSTLSEVYAAGVPFAYITRDGFRESAVLAEFVEQNMAGIEISEEEYKDNAWLDKIIKLLELETYDGKRENGADQAAEFILQRIIGRDGVSKRD